MSSRSAVIAALACLAVALTGCTSAPLMTAVTHSVPTPTPLQLTGTALQSALLPLSDFPPGYAIDTQNSSNSGSSLLSGTPSPTASPKGCNQLVTAAIQPAAGLTAGVQQDLYDTTIARLSGYHQRRYTQFVLQFATPSGAIAYLNSLRSAISRCPTVTSEKKGVTGALRQTLSPASQVAEHQAFLLRQAGTVNRVSTDQTALFTVAGTDVYAVGAGVFGVPLTAQPSSFAVLMAKLITRVQAMS